MRAHFWNGLALILVGILVTILGLFLAMTRDVYWILYFIFVFVCLAAYCTLQAWRLF